jgi:hypothetical protein
MEATCHALAVYRAVYLHQQPIADVARELEFSLPTAYRALAEVQALVNEVRCEWARWIDL